MQKLSKRKNKTKKKEFFYKINRKDQQQHELWQQQMLYNICNF